ncbi:MAG TPA: hypothetical protein VNA15_04870 [Candidatus Angelobacter sp.]|nr:hypothetical protein [Candidatus Angelobacter sp.]
MNKKTRNILLVALASGTACVATVVLLLGLGVLLPHLVQNPGGPHETLCLDSSQVNSPTNMTLNLHNCSTPGLTVSMIAYYVKSNQAVYNNTNWAGPSIPWNGSATVNIVIHGNAFTFQSGFYYEITIVTHREIATFTIKA